MIADAVKAQLGIEIDRKRIEHSTIKVAGAHVVVVNLYREINAKLDLLVGDASTLTREASDQETTEEAEEAAEETVEEATEKPVE